MHHVRLKGKDDFFLNKIAINSRCVILETWAAFGRLVAQNDWTFTIRSPEYFTTTGPLSRIFWKALEGRFNFRSNFIWFLYLTSLKVKKD